MKSLVVLLVFGTAAYFGWQKFSGAGAPPVIEDPVYAEIRGTANIQDREIEMVLFGRASSDDDCRVRARRSLENALKACPSCQMQPVSCSSELPSRYARLFDDVPIPSTYLSLTAGAADERDARIVVYGLTDAEGALMCNLLREMTLKNFRGTAHCVAASGG